MDPVSLVLAALAAGVSTGLGDAAAAAVKDAYTSLRSSLTKKFGSSRAEEVLEEHAHDPDTYEKPMAKVIRESGAADDELVLAAARRVMALADPEGTSAGKYNVHAEGSVIGAIGDHATVNYSGPPPVPPRSTQ